MTANPEFVDNYEAETTSNLPSFNLDFVTDPDTRNSLVADQMWLLENPDRRLLALRLYVLNPATSKLSPHSAWPRLTDPNNGLLFDDVTETELNGNEVYQARYAGLLGEKEELNADDEASWRILKLHFFLRRAAEMKAHQARTARPLGKTSLGGAR